ncbi:MAG: large conductance mechanosensitive channel protein MscL [Streptosporangiales bacterium]|nr:large conductance mechanosensitive channel protein MscL [Streptosporangiales bacterium]
MSGFRKFLLRGNVVDLAVAVVIGAAFGTVVTALVEDFITPLISLFGGLPDFSSLQTTVGQAVFRYGHFVNALLSFLLVSAVIYFLLVVPIERLRTRFTPETDPEAPTRECPECLSTIPEAARRCAHCASELSPSAS